MSSCSLPIPAELGLGQPEATFVQLDTNTSTAGKQPAKLSVWHSVVLRPVVLLGHLRGSRVWPVGNVETG